MELTDEELEITVYALGKLLDYPEVWPFAKEGTVRLVEDLHRKMKEAGYGS